MQILLAILVINSFILLLCGLVSLGSRLFSLTGKAELKINDNPPAMVECGQSLFSALGENSVFLPAACGGKGTCGRCQVQIRNGGGPLTPLERVNLQDDELKNLMRLACQVKVRGDIEAVVAEQLLGAAGYVVELAAVETVAEDIKTLTFKLADGESLAFKPGQYLQVFYQLPWEKVVRAYSISSDPAVTGSFTLDVQRVEGGLVSSMLHQLQPGQKLEVCGPFGEMHLQPQDMSRPVILVAGGVGLAPLRAMVESLRANNFAQPVILFHGARSRKNLYFEEYFQKLAHEYDNFSYIPVLSNPMIEEGWLYARGMVHETVEKTEILSTASAFICGPAPMMQAVTKVLVAKGIASDRIFTDPFDF